MNTNEQQWDLNPVQTNAEHLELRAHGLVCGYLSPADETYRPGLG